MWIGFGDFFFWVFTGNGGYLTSLGSWTTIMARGWGNFGIFAGANAAAFLSIMYMTWRGGIRKADADLWLWLAGAVIGASSGFHFFGHYFLQLLPPIVILATGALARNGSRFRWTMLTASGLSATIFLVLALTWPSSAQEHNNTVAQKIQDRVPSRKSSILVWGMNPEIYFMANRPPASRFITAGLLSGFAGGGDQTDPVVLDFSSGGPIVGLAKDLLRDPNGNKSYPNVPAAFVDDSQDKPYSPDKIKVIGDLLSNYRCVDSVGLTRICTLQEKQGVVLWAEDIVDKAARWEFLHPPKDNP
jgi:hypothetical protein